MSLWKDIFGFDFFTEPGPPPAPHEVMRYQGGEYRIGDDIVLRGKTYTVKEFDGSRWVIVEPKRDIAVHLGGVSSPGAEEIRRRLNDGDGA